MVSEKPSAVLKLSGYRAVIEPDRWLHGAYTLVVDGTPQSHVNLEDPTQLFFEYVRRIGHVIDECAAPGQPITAVHLGAGALTIPRYVEATRPGSRQQVIELEQDLVDLVRSTLPWQRDASIRVRYGDAREVLGRLPLGLHGTVDLLVCDVFGGARTPPHVTSLEFYQLVASLLAADGVIAVNVADGPGLAFARGQAATLAQIADQVIALAETRILKGRRYGNVVLVGSAHPLPQARLSRLLAGDPSPAKVVAGQELTDWIAGAAVVTDATAVASPPPSRTVFQVGNRHD